MTIEARTTVLGIPLPKRRLTEGTVLRFKRGTVFFQMRVESDDKLMKIIDYDVTYGELDQRHRHQEIPLEKNNINREKIVISSKIPGVKTELSWLKTA